MPEESVPSAANIQNTSQDPQVVQTVVGVDIVGRRRTIRCAWDHILPEGARCIRLAASD